MVNILNFGNIKYKNNMDGLNSFFSSIENGLLRLNLSLSNDLKIFIFNLKSSSEYQKGKTLIESDLQFFGEELIDRVFKLVKMDYDKTYLFPYDISLASYLYLSSEIDIELYSQILNLIHEAKLVNIWWTSQVMDYLSVSTNSTNTDRKNFTLSNLSIFENQDKLNSNSKTQTIIN